MKLSLPKKARKQKPPEQVEAQLDKGLEDSFPASDPVAATAPGGPVQPDEDPGKKGISQNPRGSTH